MPLFLKDGQQFTLAGGSVELPGLEPYVATEIPDFFCFLHGDGEPSNVSVNVAAASNHCFQVQRDPPLTFNRLLFGC